MGLKEDIIERLDRLDEGQLREVLEEICRKEARFSNALTVSDFVQRFTGLFPPEDAAEIQRIIEEDCEKIDSDAWDLPAGHNGSDSPDRQ
jgi:predicted RNA-binding protein